MLDWLFKRKKEDVPAPEVAHESPLEQTHTVKKTTNDDLLTAINDISSRMAKEETLINVSAKIDALPAVGLINEVIKKIEAGQIKLTDKSKQELYVQRSKFYKEDIMTTIKDMINRGENTFANIVADKLVPAKMARATFFKTVDRLIKSGELVRQESGKFVLYIPFEMLNEEQKQLLKQKVEDKRQVS